MHQDLLDRAAATRSAAAATRMHSEQAIIRADQAIHRALRESERASYLVSIVGSVHVVVAEAGSSHRVTLRNALIADERTQLVADAVDGPEALGAIIVSQPDVAVLDDQLALLRGRDVAIRVRLYAPQTRTMVLIDPSDPLFTARPPSIDAIYPRDGDRRAAVELIARLAA